MESCGLRERIMKLRRTFVLVVGWLAVFCVAVQSRGDVRLAGVLGEHMVLQRGQAIPVWGWADVGEKVTVDFGGEAVSTMAGDDGRWMVKLPAREAGGPGELRVRGKNALVLKDVLVGEVWICSGQSNMEWTVANSNDVESERAAAKYAKIRHGKSPKLPDGFPQDDVEAGWTVC